MRPLPLPRFKLRRHEPKKELPVRGKRFEIVLLSAPATNLVRSAVKLARTPGVLDVTATTESGKGAIWRVLASRPDVDVSWLGVALPHSKQVGSASSFKGSYAKTDRGTWRVALGLIPVKDEGLERNRLIAYRGAAGVSLEVKDKHMTFGFVLETASPKEGTRIAQSALLDTAAKAGARCEILADPRFAAVVDGLLSIAEDSS